MERKLYKPTEFARLTGVHYETVLRWLKNGYIPAVRMGKRWFIPIEVVYQMARNRTEERKIAVPLPEQPSEEKPEPPQEQKG